MDRRGGQSRLAMALRPMNGDTIYSVFSTFER
jgi:hypothetical protein